MTATPYRLVVFDWEGTLSDSFGYLLACIANEAKRYQMGTFDMNKARELLEFGLTHTIGKLFPQLSLLERETLLAAIESSLPNYHGGVYLMPYAKALLTKLYENNILLAIASNKGHQSLERALTLSGLLSLFSVMRCASQVPPKPNPTMLYDILDVLAVRPSEVLMIGDSAIDMEMAVKVGVDALAVNFDHKESEGLRAAGAKAVFTSFQAVADYLHIGSLALEKE